MHICCFEEEGAPYGCEHYITQTPFEYVLDVPAYIYAAELEPAEYTASPDVETALKEAPNITIIRSHEEVSEGIDLVIGDELMVLTHDIFQEDPGFWEDGFEPAEVQGIPLPSDEPGTGDGVAQEVYEPQLLELREVDRLTEEQFELIQEIECLYPNIGTNNHYYILGVPSAASLGDIKSSYFTFAKKFHPDRNRFLDEEHRRMAKAIFVRVSSAYEILGDAAARNTYDKALEADLVQRREKDLFEADVCFKEGSSLLRSKIYGEALGFIERAFAADPGNNEYKVALLWTRFQLAPDEEGLVSELRLALRKAIALDPDSPVYRYYMGRVLKHTNMLGRTDR